VKTTDWIQIILFVALLCGLTAPLGRFFHRVLSGERNILSPVLGGLERFIYRAGGVDPAQSMEWREYLRVYITHLRKKVERDPAAPTLIVNEPGIGYRLAPE
jgi:K+-transporting ATPase ATPase A chain